MVTKLGWLRAVVFLVATVAACSSPEPVTASPIVAVPGERALSGDLSCKTSADCDTGEACIDGACQLQSCGTQAYRSAPPLGKQRFFAVDRELVVLDETKIDGYEPTDGSFAHPSDLTVAFDGKKIVDLAGGNFFGRRPEGIVAALESDTSLHVVAGTNEADVALGFIPIAVAAGDIDGDGTDEAVALSAQGEVAVCDVGKGTCEKRTIPSIKTALDLTVADVDADGHAEPVVLGNPSSGNTFLVVMNFDDAASGQSPTEEIDTGHKGTRVSAGDIDHAGAAEILVLEDGGYLGYASDTVRIFGRNGQKLTDLGSNSVAKDSVDILAGDIDGDDKADLLVLEDSGLEVFSVDSPTAIKSSFKSLLSASTKPTRLSLADLDGDSPSGSLVGDAETVSGPVIPTSVVIYPPYSRTRSDGTGQIGIGNRESKEELEATTVTLRAALTLGYEADFPGIARVAVSGRVEGSIAKTNANGNSISLGDRYTVDAKPETEGKDNAVVVLACACYHAYTYTIDDPSGRLGSKDANGKKMSLFVPVGGQTALWSLKRYNALAERLTNLPVVRVPYTVGDPTSYPTSQQTLAGAPVPEADLVSTTPKAYRVSDVARVGWQLDLGEKASQTETTTIGVSVRGTLRVAGILAEAEVGASQASAFTVSMGKEASFSGSVPPIRNDPKTPEDEHALYSYGFSPIVYRDFYETKDGGKGGFFVVTYSVVQ